jgi:hypothetical protein
MGCSSSSVVAHEFCWATWAPNSTCSRTAGGTVRRREGQLVPASVAHAQRWPGLAFVEVSDIAGSDIALAWDAGSVPVPVRAFLALAADLDATEPPGPAETVMRPG